jgi:hypothetical protein
VSDEDKEELRNIIREELLKHSNSQSPYCQHKWVGLGYTFHHNEVCTICGTKRGPHYRDGRSVIGELGT